MPADALDTSGARTSAGIVLIPKPIILSPASEKLIIELKLTYCQLDVHVKNKFKMHHVK